MSFKTRPERCRERQTDFPVTGKHREHAGAKQSIPKSFPKPDCFTPPKGAATSVLLYVFTNTVPASSLSLTYMALLMSLVKTPEARPYSVLFARCNTPSMSLQDVFRKTKLH